MFRISFSPSRDPCLGSTNLCIGLIILRLFLLNYDLRHVSDFANFAVQISAHYAVRLGLYNNARTGNP